MTPKVKPNWPTIFAHFRKSGLSRAKYCRIHKLSPSSFAYHAKSHKAHVPDQHLKSSNASFIEVRERGTEFKLKINDSLTLSFESLPEASWLSAFVQSLGVDHARS
jgi:hypothetical protein